MLRDNIMELYDGIILRNYITGSYHGIILWSDIMGLHYGTIFRNYITGQYDGIISRDNITE